MTRDAEEGLRHPPFDRYELGKIGDRPRRKPRDLYDTGWLVHERPELISSDSAARLKDWMISSLSEGRKAQLKQDMQTNRVIGHRAAARSGPKIEVGTDSRCRQREKRSRIEPRQNGGGTKSHEVRRSRPMPSTKDADREYLPDLEPQAIGESQAQRTGNGLGNKW